MLLSKNAVTRLQAIVLIVIIVVAAVIVGVGYYYLTRPTGEESRSIKVGHFGPLTFDSGKNIRDGALLAVEQINAAGGVLGRNMTFIEADDQMSAETGISAVEKLVLTDKVDVVIGGYLSGIMAATLHVAEDNKVPWIGCSGGATVITDTIIQNNYKYCFMCNPGWENWAVAQAEAMVDLIKELNYTKIAVIYDELEWTSDIAAACIPLYEENFDVVYYTRVDFLTEDFTIELNICKERGAQIIDVVLAAAGPYFISQWYAMKIPALVAGMDVLAGSGAYWDETDGKCYSECDVALGYMGPVTAKTVPYYEAFQARFGYIPYCDAAMGYDAVYMYKEALEIAGTTDPEAVVDALWQVEYVGINPPGIFSFDNKTHHLYVGPDRPLKVGITQWQGPAPEGLKIIYPFDQPYTADIVFPPWLQG